MLTSIFRRTCSLLVMFIMTFSTSTVINYAFTAETLTVSFDYVTPGGSYTPRHCVVAWIERKTDGAFIKTIGRYADRRAADLATWTGKSGGKAMDSDAVMGATITTFARRNWVWDLKARGSTAQVADGVYVIKFEVDAGNNADGFVEFNINGIARTETPANSGNFRNITLTYTGRTVGAPAFTTQPNNVTVTAGASAAFTVVATGATSYQWQRNATNITGATSASYTLNPTAIADNGVSFRCIATNTTGSTTSSAATLTVNAAAPTVTGPTAQPVVAGSTATFSVTATSLVAMTYQWKVSTNGVGGTYNNVTAGSGATTASYTTAATVIGDNGNYYRCVVTNSSNGNLATTSGTALLTVNAAVVAPNITANPASITRADGQTATFTVTATGSPLNYQWKRGATNVGTNSNTYSFTCALANNGDSYTCVVTNAGGANPATSTAAILTVNAAIPVPVISGAAIASVYANNSFSYTFTATGSPTTFAASGLPTGLSVPSAATGTISGTPTESGVFSVTLSATNATGTGTKPLELTVIGEPDMTSETAVSALVNTAFTYTITATNMPTSFAATGLPAGLTINTTNGQITGTPTVLGTFNVDLTMTNLAGTGTETLSLTVGDGSTPAAAPAEPKKCGYGTGFSTFLLMMLASLSLMISNRRGAKPD
jgi:Putative Ig domain